MISRCAHNSEIAGLSPAPATTIGRLGERLSQESAKLRTSVRFRY